MVRILPKKEGEKEANETKEEERGEKEGDEDEGEGKSSSRAEIEANKDPAPRGDGGRPGEHTNSESEKSDWS